MANDKAKELFAQKITSREQFNQLLIEAEIYDRSGRPDRFIYADEKTPAYSRDYLVVSPGAVGDFMSHEWGATSTYPVHVWWLLRERIREALGVYEPLPQCLAGVIFHGFAAHVSKEDRNMLAYTASASDGENDRQVRVSPGKLIRKLNLWVSDEEVKNLEAAYRAEMSDELELLTGAENFAHVYQNMEGDSGCMRHGPHKWNLPHDMHPSVVYDMPGFAIAVHRNHRGAIIARSVTWVNPDDPSDRRFVRLYGDPVLGRKLQRNGYVRKGLHGALLKRIPHPNGKKHTFLMPYIDMPGRDDGTWATLEEGGIRMVTKKMADEILQADNGGSDTPYVAHAQSHETVSVKLRPVPAELFTYTCGLDGQQYDSRSEPSTEFVRADGEIIKVRAASVPRESWSLFIRRPSGGTVVLPAAPGLPTFDHSGDIWADTEKTRTDLGYRRLALEFYPDRQDWFLLTSDDTTTTESGHTILKADAVTRLELVGGLPETRTVHKQQVQSTDVRLYKVGRGEVYAASDVETFVTPSGKRVHPHTHDLTRLFDGSYDFTRNVRTTFVLGRHVSYSVGTTPPTLAQCTQMCGYIEAQLQAVLKLCRDAGHDRAQTVAAVTTTIRNTARRYPVRQGYWTLSAFSQNTSLDQVRGSCTAALADAEAGAEHKAWAEDLMFLIGKAEEFIAQHLPEEAQAERFSVAAA